MNLRMCPRNLLREVWKLQQGLDSFYIVDETILLSKTNQLTNDKYCSLSRTCRYANLTVSAPLSAWGDKVQSQILKRGEIRKKWVLGGDLKSSCHRYLSEGGLLCFLFKKDLALRAQFQILTLACFSQTTN